MYYVQLDNKKRVIGISDLNIITEEDPRYDILIPIQLMDMELFGKIFVGRNENGYGIFEDSNEPVINPEPQPTLEEMLLHTQLNTEYLVCLQEINNL